MIRTKLVTHTGDQTVTTERIARKKLEFVAEAPTQRVTVLIHNDGTVAVNTMYFNGAGWIAGPNIYLPVVPRSAAPSPLTLELKDAGQG